MRTGKRKPLRWVLWHPYQGLWNWTLQRVLERLLPGQKLSRWAIDTLVTLDTLFLWRRAIWERLKLVGLSRDLWAPHLPPRFCLLYVDMGTHREARELVWALTHVFSRYTSQIRAFGFEAGRAYYQDAVQRTTHLPQVRMIHAALCRRVPREGRVRLYISPADGRASSLYREAFGTYEEAPALQFSQWFREHVSAPEKWVIILRMNIEGAEEEVIRDIAESGILAHIDGFFGMWDDVAKDDPKRGAAFHHFLKELGIRPFTFNDRDFQSAWRMRCIEYALVTALLRGVRRKQGAQCDV